MKYKKSKIYKIVSPSTNQIYVGATTSLISATVHHMVVAYHKYLEGDSVYRDYFEIFKYNDYTVILVQLVPCDSLSELYQHLELYRHKIYDNIEIKNLIECQGRKFRPS